MADAGAIRLGVGGALGRMGRAVILAAEADPGLNIVARFGRPGSEGEHGLVSRDEALSLSEVVVDVSSPAASAALATAAARASGARGGGLALVLGATGYSAAEEAAIAEAARALPIVKSGNFSIGVNVLAALVRQAAERLGPELWDIEILEAHHRHKRDAPSGTARLLGEAAAAGRGAPLADLALPPRDGLSEPRPPGAIGFASLRGGGIIGEHSVIFAAEEEVITLSHSARDRGLFARGALAAAQWVRGKGPGVYGMGEVLGFTPPR